MPDHGRFPVCEVALTQSAVSPSGQIPKLHLRILPWTAIGPAEQLVGLRVADHLFVAAVPLDAAAEFEREHSQQAEVGRQV